MNLLEELQVKPGSRVAMRDDDAARTPGIGGKARARSRLKSNREALAILQHRLWGENRRALLVVLQGTDTSGKDGVIRHVFTGLNPQGCHVTSFKKPSEEDQDHDFLWRIHKAAPGRGEVGVFNRSHYEDVLVTRVRGLVARDVWRGRYKTINDFERILISDSTTILKICLHISRDEQRRRLQARLRDPEKRWKFNAGDLEERRHWDDYVAAYQDMLSRCSTAQAPWHVVPADHKWYRNWAVSELLLRTLQRMNPQLPTASFEPGEFVVPE